MNREKFGYIICPICGTQALASVNPTDFFCKNNKCILKEGGRNLIFLIERNYSMILEKKTYYDDSDHTHDDRIL